MKSEVRKCSECGDDFIPNRPWRLMCYKPQCKKDRAARLQREHRHRTKVKKSSALYDKERFERESNNAKRRNMFLLGVK